MSELNFSQDEETLDNLLQRDLEKVYNKIVEIRWSKLMMKPLKRL